MEQKRRRKVSTRTVWGKGPLRKSTEERKKVFFGVGGGQCRCRMWSGRLQKDQGEARRKGGEQEAAENHHGNKGRWIRLIRISSKQTTATRKEDPIFAYSSEGEEATGGR